jgi:hypothetical protein
MGDEYRRMSEANVGNLSPWNRANLEAIVHRTAAGSPPSPSIIFAAQRRSSGVKV